MELTRFFKGFFFETSRRWKIELWATLELLPKLMRWESTAQACSIG
jgi:hypothetical protein